MKIRDTRLLAVFIAVAFLVLWCASVNVTCAVPAQEPLSEPIAQSSTAPEIEAIGICGWAIVGVGTMGVVVTVILSCRTPKRRRAKAFSSGTFRKRTRAVYATRHRNIERRM